jgi:uncharacterized protein (TIGR02996 family)
MDHHAAFLSAILEAPDDDTPRLIYADWLEERGDPRAEFIRIQCELARLPDDDERRTDLEATEARLLAEHAKGWAGPIRRWARHWSFRRGFVEGIKIRTGAFLVRADELFAAAPIRHVQLVHSARIIDHLAACPYLARLESLNLQANFTLPTAPEVPGIPERPVPMEYRQAGWRARYEAINAAKANCQAAGVDHLRRLLGSPHLKRLRALGLEDNRLGGSGILALLDWKGLDELTALDLRRNALGQEDVQTIVDSGRLGRLRSLRLGHCRNGGGYAAMLRVGDYEPEMDEEAEQWQDSERGRICQYLAPLVSQLTDLDLGSCLVTDLAINDLAELPKPPVLTSLRLDHNCLGRRGVEALLRSRLCDRLALLDLGSCYLEADALHLLAGCPNLSGLTSLFLNNNSPGVEGVRALAASPHLTRLARLSLAGAQRSAGSWTNEEFPAVIGDQKVKILADSAGRLPRLAWLDLRKNGLGAAATRNLVSSPLLEQLAWLDLRHNRLGNEGAALFAVAVPWPRLARLDLRDNDISPAIGHRLRARFGARVLY